MARGYAEICETEAGRLAHARAFCAAAVAAYWITVCERNGAGLQMLPVPQVLPSLAEDVQILAARIGRLVAEFPLEDAGYLIGAIYTVMLPPSLRARMGAYYTPPPLVTRLLDMAEFAGFDFTHGTVVDPACGGGAFLAPVAMRMIARAGNASPQWTLRRLSARLRGIELDPFAGWMTRVLLESAIMPLCLRAGRRLANVVTIADALDAKVDDTFDLVVGNPPYGRVKLDDRMRAQYARSLYGHANLYGLFTDLALRLVKPGGVVAYLTPTSFLGGQYFKALRSLLAEEVSPATFDFVSDRDGVFDDVLQETMLTTYRKVQAEKAVQVSVLIPQGLNAARVEKVGDIRISPGGMPWLLPRAAEDVGFLRAMMTMPTRLVDLGYTVSTGPLVWNRHKPQLRVEAAPGALPLVWAEAVTPDGFMFDYERRNHVPYFAVTETQAHLVVRDSCVLVQRTTSKEQNRRLVAAVLPQSFLDEHGGAVIENHLNMIKAPAAALARVSPRTLAALLNSEVLDRAFRCISGSVAVSAYELNALPLPSLEQLKEVERLVEQGAEPMFIERAISSFYEVR